MLKIIDTETGKEYEIARFDRIRKGDLYLSIDLDNDYSSFVGGPATTDHPEYLASYILEEIKPTEKSS